MSTRPQKVREYPKAAARLGKREYNPRSTVERRLKEYAEWRTQPTNHYAPTGSIFGRIAEMQDNAGARGSGIKPDIVVVDGEAVACRPDGGLSRTISRSGRQIAMDNRCVEVHELVRLLPNRHIPIFEAAYIGEHREVPRSDEETAERLKVSKGKYQMLKGRMLEWFQVKLLLDR